MEELKPMKKFCVSAPGKIILFGEHAVVYGKSAVAVGINLRTKVTVAETDSSLIEIHWRNLKSTTSWTFDKLDELCAPITSNPLSPTVCLPDCQKAIAKFLSGDALPDNVQQSSSIFLFLYTHIVGKNRNFSGLKVDVETEIPIGAGLGSSGSLSVCLSAALLFRAAVLKLKKLDGGCSLSQPNEEDKTIINQWAFMAEKISHANPSGVDNCVCTYGGSLLYKCGDFQPLKRSRQLRILAVNSMVTRNTMDLVKLVANKRDENPRIINLVLDAIDEIATKFVKISDSPMLLDMDFHIELTDLIDKNQGLLNTLGVSHHKLEEIIAVAKQHSLGAKLTGAGGGGFAFILIRRDIEKDKLDELIEHLVEKGFQYYDAIVGGPGVEVHAVTPL